jgi:hypothetical protein
VGLYSDEDIQTKNKSNIRQRLKPGASEGSREVPWIWRAPRMLDKVSKARDWQGVEGLHDGMFEYVFQHLFS